MSILNSQFTDADMLTGSTENAAVFLSDVLENIELTERQQSILDHLNEGLSLGDILGITKDHRDVLINQAAIFIQAGDLEKAREVLVKVIQFEPTEERAFYALGITYQMDADLERAAYFYLNFLALDATNPEGYLRLGECLMSAGELDEARASIQTALEFAREGKGRPDNAAQAENLLAIIGAAEPAA